MLKSRTSLVYRKCDYYGLSKIQDAYMKSKKLISNQFDQQRRMVTDPAHNVSMCAIAKIGKSYMCNHQIFYKDNDIIISVEVNDFKQHMLKINSAQLLLRSLQLCAHSSFK